jgi:hypothetical protein
MLRSMRAFTLVTDKYVYFSRCYKQYHIKFICEHHHEIRYGKSNLTIIDLIVYFETRQKQRNEQPKENGISDKHYYVFLSLIVFRFKRALMCTVIWLVTDKTTSECSWSNDENYGPIKIPLRFNAAVVVDWRDEHGVEATL